MPRNIVKDEKLCKRYRSKLDELPDHISREELDSIVGSLYTITYMQALQELDPVVTRKDASLNRDKLGRVEGLVRKSVDLVEGKKLLELFTQKTHADYRSRIVKPDVDKESFTLDLSLGDNCWITPGSDFKSSGIKKKVSWLLKGIKVGQCIYLFGEQPDPEDFIPQVQTRLHIAKTKRDEPVVFIDAIEAGNMSWDSISRWINHERGNELLYTVAGAIFIAQHYGTSKVVLGERETQELGTLLGLREETLFSEEQEQRNIGFKTCYSGVYGPYHYRLHDSEKRRVVNLENLAVLSSDDVSSKLTRLSEFLEQNKKVRRNKNKMREIGLYLDCLQAINELSGNRSQESTSLIDNMMSEYF